MEEIRGSPELERAIQLLTPREHSVLELRLKLVKRHIAPAKIDAIISYLLELDYLSDERFSEAYTRQRIKKGDGPLKIRANLQQRGIDEDLIENALASDDEFWLEQAQSVLSKRYNESYAEGIRLTYDEWSKRGKFLASRGFPHHVVRQAIGDFQSS